MKCKACYGKWTYSVYAGSVWYTDFWPRKRINHITPVPNIKECPRCKGTGFEKNISRLEKILYYLWWYK